MAWYKNRAGPAASSRRSTPRSPPSLYGMTSGRTVAKRRESALAKPYTYREEVLHDLKAWSASRRQAGR